MVQNYLCDFSMNLECIMQWMKWFLFVSRPADSFYLSKDPLKHPYQLDGALVSVIYCLS